MKNFRFDSNKYNKILLKKGNYVFLVMQHIQGISYQQMRVSSLEDAISLDNQVRFLDAFVNVIVLAKFNFELRTLKSEGRPRYNTRMFLKVYLYGYFNSIRSFLKLEKEC